jgi:tetratricopeptide (TPR) repeat protein
MRTRFAVLGLCLALLSLGLSVLAQTPEELEAQREARFNDLWTEADQVQTRGEFSQAEQLYRQILTEFPDSQRTALRVAITQARGGDFQGAMESYDAAIEIDPDSSWAATGLFYMARDCWGSGDREAAQREVDRLLSTHPDSSFVAQARLLEARMEGSGVSEAEAELQRELEAAGVYDSAMGLSRQGEDDEALSALEQVIENYPGTGASLRALDAQGHILIRNQHHEEALSPFLRIMERTAELSPESRAARVARTRVAAINHVLGNRDEALSHYLALLEELGDESPEAANAMLQGSGVYFEILQRRMMSGENVEPGLWDELRDMMRSVHEMVGASSGQLIRADLMAMETLSWQGSAEGLIVEVECFLATWDTEEFRGEIATAHFFAGENYLKLGEIEPALEHFQWIIDVFEGESEIWPNMDHLPRTLYRKWQILIELEAPSGEIASAASALLDAFPETAYSFDVRMAAQSGALWGRGITPPSDELRSRRSNLSSN